MKRLIATLSTLFVFAFLLTPPADVQAQSQPRGDIWETQGNGNGDGPGGPPAPPGAPIQTPIGSGLGILLAAGGAYAVRRLRQQKQD
ncbi:hypothetical protein CYPRO_1110 [Cyclonatronum proteinivorum]|uniref:MYXO-CTERM domain-containing protein n=1 Tax=Cyclonatronum proteinivorum TaxID=1457365 RepID=A0A345UIS3_9BACT|nr:hypothetical protein [Cyclonatronum proteinivorum]AXJ00375.1 hypothetical protein CYPRO_1110 [Cyclonatronum proteinivorum]